MADAAWYEQMASAMKKREKCLNAIARWQDDLAVAEAEIEALRAGEAAEDDEEPEPVAVKAEPAPELMQL